MTTLADLEPIARNLLTKHGSVLLALPEMRKLLMKRSDLLDALARAYLESLSFPSANEALMPKVAVLRDNAAVGHTPTDAHAARADGGALISESLGQDQPDAHLICAEGEDAVAGHRTIVTHPSRAGDGVTIHAPKRKLVAAKAAKPITVRAHRRSTQHRRTAAERAVALDAMAENLSSVFGRPILGRAIGTYHWRELPDLRRRLTSHAVDHLLLGKTAAEEAILIDKLLCYASASSVDHSALVSDVISAQHFAELEIEAGRDALPKLDVSKGAAHAEFVRQLTYSDNP